MTDNEIPNDRRIRDVIVTETEVVVLLHDGRKISVPLSWYPSLSKARAESRSGWELGPGAESARWPELGLNIASEDLLRAESPGVKYLREGPFDEEFLQLLDTMTMTKASKGLRFCGSAYGKGMSENQISKAEDIVGAPFPEDFRLFLKNLHDPEGVFFPWASVSKAEYRKALERIVNGLLFDVENNAFWLGSWGDKPKSKSASTELVRSEVEKWPKLAPVLGHRYLVIEPKKVGNPVLSIHQSDIVYYGPDIGRYLCNEFLKVGLNSWIDCWRWANAPSRAEFDPWNRLACGKG